MTPWLDDGDVRLYHGDALETLRALPDGSVDCVVTSPPYWGLRCYGVEGQMGLEETPDLFVAGMVELFREVRRLLADHGTCWVNLGDSYAHNGASGGSSPVGDRKYRETDRTKQEAMGYSVPPGLKTKDLVGIPWRVAFALQADGWYLRSDIIWSKPNPMPESVTDRPTKAHEYVFMLTKQPRYWFDTEAVREPSSPNTHSRGSGIGVKNAATEFGQGIKHNEDYARAINGHVNARNVRSVWQIATQPYPEAHFATFPEELARRCILAGCPTRVCRVCGKPSERIVEKEFVKTRGNAGSNRAEDPTGYDKGAKMSHPLGYGRYDVTTTGWSDCGHNAYRPGLVFDPFIGSGTVAKVARDHQRHAIGIDLNLTYLELAARRLQQLSLLAEGTA